jgi:hypothetical protein
VLLSRLCPSECLATPKDWHSGAVNDSRIVSTEKYDDSRIVTSTSYPSTREPSCEP